jgi:diguanylate cyclase (GGDEF)-like protein
MYVTRPRMISIQKSVNDLGWKQEQLRAALKAYVELVDAQAETAVQGAGGSRDAFLRQLQAVRREAGAMSDPAPQALRENSSGIALAVRTCHAELQEYLNGRNAELRQVITVLGQALEAVTASSGHYSGQVGKFTRDLDKLVEKESPLAELRECLGQLIPRLSTCLEQYWRDTEESMAELRNQVHSFQERLESAEKAAATDPLTGLCNRREGERWIRRHIQTGHPLSLIVVDLNRFKAINDRWGHQVGDQILTNVAGRLQQFVRPGDVVCRWGGDEFVVLMPCSIVQAMARARQVSDRLRGLYRVAPPGQAEVRVEVGAASGVAEHRSGETAEELFSRADLLLYQEKARECTSRVAP